MREYETLYYVRSDAPEERVTKVQDKLKETIEKKGKGSILGFKDWGSKRTAYEVKKEKRPRMTLMGYCSPGSVIIDVERELRLDDVVLRYITRKISDDGDPAVKKTEFENRIVGFVQKESPDGPREGYREGYDDGGRSRGRRETEDVVNTKPKETVTKAPEKSEPEVKAEAKETVTKAPEKSEPEVKAEAKEAATKAPEKSEPEVKAAAAESIAVEESAKDAPVVEETKEDSDG